VTITRCSLPSLIHRLTDDRTAAEPFMPLYDAKRKLHQKNSTVLIFATQVKAQLQDKSTVTHTALNNTVTIKISVHLEGIEATATHNVSTV